jgi:transposase
MDAELAALPDDVDTLKAALLAARADVAWVIAEAAAALAQQSSDLALIAHLKLQIEKLNRDRFGPRSERTSRLLDQMELQLEELEASATKDELAAEAAAAQITDGATHVAGFTRKHPVRRRGGGR